MSKPRQDGLLVIVAHPDDEFFCAGALAAATEKRIAVHVVYWTRGEGGCTKRTPSLFPRGPFFNPRVGETKKALACLNVASWEFLDYIDPPPKSGLKAPSHDTKTFQEEIRNLIKKHRPRLVLSHGSNGEYGHPAHLALNKSVEAVLKNDATDTGFITFGSAHPDPRLHRMQNPDDRANIILDASPFTEQKLGVLRAHASQQNVWKKLVPESMGSLEEVVALSQLEHYSCTSNGERQNAHAALFREWTGAMMV